MDILLLMLGWLFLLLAAIPVLFFTLMTVAACLPERSQKVGKGARRIAIVIPAHNESLLISETVKAAVSQNYVAEQYTVVVIADNCTDDTATKARQAGARVIERSGPPGKGQALFHAFEGLLQEDWDAFLIVDADSLLHTQALRVLDNCMEAGARVIQLRYAIRNPEDSIRTRALELGMASFNALRPKGRTALGMSSGIFGNGFCISREALEAVPYLAHSIVEDIEYHIHLLRKGYRTVFSDKACVYAEMPTSVEASKTQRIRWERGRWLTIKSYAGELFRRSLKGDRCAFDGLTDVLTPPATMMLYPLLGALICGDTAVRILTGALFILLCLHYLVASIRYGSVKGLFRIACFVPWYLIWKTWIYIVSTIKEKNLGWNRTGRE